jgi:hypothetical protein
MKLGLDWGLDKMMMTLVEPSVLDFGKRKKILRDNVVLPLICGGLILLPREIRVIPPPWIMSQNMAHWTAFDSC